MELAVKQQFMEEEDKEISRQLAMSKPLVTEMLEFLSSKSNQGEATSEMAKLIMDIQQSLQDCVRQANMFKQAAYYDAGAASQPFSSLKDGGGRNPLGIGTEQLQQLLDEN